MAVDFSNFLNVSMDDVPKSIPTLPGGHFFADITGWKTEEADYGKKTGAPKTPVVVLTFKVTNPDDDVDENDDGYAACIGKTATKNYSLNDPDKAGQVMLRRLAEVTCGLDIKGMGLEDVLDALKGQPVRIFNEPRLGEEEGQRFAKITRVLPVE